MDDFDREVTPVRQADGRYRQRSVQVAIIITCYETPSYLHRSRSTRSGNAGIREAGHGYIADIASNRSGLYGSGPIAHGRDPSAGCRTGCTPRRVLRAAICVYRSDGRRLAGRLYHRDSRIAANDRTAARQHRQYRRLGRSALDADASGGFTVKLNRSGRVLVVPADKTILEVLEGAGLDVPWSCREGICASCETRVLSGVVDHRDSVLTKAEKASNDVMMVCCSRAKSPELVLDL